MLAIVGAENGIDGTKSTLFRRCYIKVYDDDYEVIMQSVMISGDKKAWEVLELPQIKAVLLYHWKIINPPL